MSKLEEATAEALRRAPDLSAVEFEEQWYSWGELRRVAEQTQDAIKATGIDSGAPIAFIPRNRPASVAALLGLLASRRTIRMIYAFQSPITIARNLGHLKPAVLVASAEDLRGEVLDQLRTCGIAAVVLDRMDARLLEGFEHSSIVTESPRAPQIEILTSGTTGPPKHFAITYEMIGSHLLEGTMIAGMGSSDPAGAPPIFLCKPIGNIAGLYSTVPTLLHGLRAVLVDRFKLENWLSYVRRYRPQHTGLPATGIQMILDALVPREALSSLRSLSAGASPVDPIVQRRFEEEYGIPILLSYGATEFAGPVAAMTPDLAEKWGKQKLGSVGRAMIGVELRVVDAVSGDILAPGMEGLLEVMAPRVGQEWIRTSDIAMIDEDGFLFIRGRADGAIMRGGFKVLPETIEHALLLHTSVSAAAVTGVPDKRLGQVPAAAIQLRPGATAPTIAELDMHLREHVLSTHIPVHWRFVGDLPMTATSKIDRPALQHLFEPIGEP